MLFRLQEGQEKGKKESLKLFLMGHSVLPNGEALQRSPGWAELWEHAANSKHNSSGDAPDQVCVLKEYNKL